MRSRPCYIGVQTGQISKNAVMFNTVDCSMYLITENFNNFGVPIETGCRTVVMLDSIWASPEYFFPKENP